MTAMQLALPARAKPSVLIKCLVALRAGSLQPKLELLLSPPTGFTFLGYALFGR